MLVVIEKDYEALSREAARIAANALRQKPDLVLGLATGGTPLGFYRELTRLHHEERLDFSRVITFNLDEYIGLPAGHPHSFHAYMHNNFFGHGNVKLEAIHIPDGMVRENYEEYCEGYERAIRDAGGIDLQILGIGKDGHIGFNEPTSSLASRTRPKTLTRETMESNREYFSKDEKQPRAAITMGIGTILDAKKILLLGSGKKKARAVALAVEGPITSSVSASALQLHRDATVLVDREAAADLKHREYYETVLAMTRELTPERLW